MKLLLSIALFISHSLALLAMHPTHMSIINMELDSDSLHIKYTIRVFQDDMNILISNLYHEELFHSTDTFNLNENTKKIDDYFTENFKLKANNNALSSTLIKKENKEFGYFLYYIVQLSEIPIYLTIENKILLNIYSDQTNLVIFSYLDIEKGLTFNAESIIQLVNLDNS